MIKFNKNIGGYDYILSFDLAKLKTGYALVPIKGGQSPIYGTIYANEKADSVWEDLFIKISDVIISAKSYCEKNGAKMFVTKEKLPNQAGKFTTIASLQALAFAHCAWELACKTCGAEVYDYDGVFSTSVKAYYRSITGIERPEKEDIANNVCRKYGIDLSICTLDTTDAVACAETLINKKFDSDIKEKIKEIKKQIQKYKSDKKKSELEDEIQRLKNFLTKG